MSTPACEIPFGQTGEEDFASLQQLADDMGEQHVAEIVAVERAEDYDAAVCPRHAPTGINTPALARPCTSGAQ